MKVHTKLSPTERMDPRVLPASRVEEREVWTDRWVMWPLGEIPERGSHMHMDRIQLGPDSAAEWNIQCSRDNNTLVSLSVLSTIRKVKKTSLTWIIHGSVTGSLMAPLHIFKKTTPLNKKIY